MRLKSISKRGALLLVMGCCAGGGAAEAGFTAGAGRADIVIPASLFPIDGFVGQHDPLAARALLLDDGTTRVGIVSVDQTSMPEASIATIKTALSRIAGVAPANALVTASHTFSAPHVLPPEHTPPALRDKTAALAQAIEDAVEAAATQANADLQPARLGGGKGMAQVNVNRDVQGPAGWWLGADDAGYTDPALSVLRVDGRDGHSLAVLIDEAVQPAVMDGSVSATGGKLVTADLAGATTRVVEAAYGPPTVAMFLVGAAGDQAPTLMANRHAVDADGKPSRNDIHDAGFPILDLLGNRLGGEALRVSRGIATTETPKLHVLRGSVEVPSQPFSPAGAPKGPVTFYAYGTGAPVAVPIVTVAIGDVALVGLQAELAASVGANIKASSPFPHTIVATMVDGAAKYMADAASYDRFTYEARNSPFGRGAAEMTAARAVELLAAVHGARNDP